MSTGAEFRFREATAEDGPIIRSIVASVLAEYGLPSDPEGIDADLADVVSGYRDRGGSFRVLSDADGAIVGCGGLYPVTEKEAEIRKMYFLPPARGLGLGRRLLDDLIALATERGFERVVIETASVLKEAVSLYRRRGFVPFTHAHPAGRCDQAYVLELRDNLPDSVEPPRSIS